MLKSELFTIASDAINVDACNADNFSVFEAVKTVVRNAEYTVASNNKKYVDLRQKFETLNPGVDALTADNADVLKTLGVDAGDFLKMRSNYLDLKHEVENCLPLETVTALPLGDRVQINLLAHQIYKGIQLDTYFPELLNDGKAEKIADYISAFYEKGASLKAFKEYIRPIVVNIFNNADCKYFHPVTTKRSFLDDWLVNHFVASFGGNAARQSKTSTTKTGDKVQEFLPYNYMVNVTKAKQMQSITDLCSVIYAQKKYHEVVKPQSTAEGK